MIAKFKKYLRRLRKDLDQLSYAQNQQWATQKLQALFAEPHFIPQTGWSMTPQAITHVLNIVSLTKPKYIIEFGSGATTLYIAKLLKTEGHNARFFSVESSKEWKNKMEKQLADYDLQDYVQLLYAPIQEVDATLRFKNQETWYDTEKLTQGIVSVSHFDLVIVDGPFGGGTPFARYSAFPFLMDKDTVSEETIWLLDDTNRADESEILSEWQLQGKLEIHSFRRYALLMHSKNFDYTPYTMQ